MTLSILRSLFIGKRGAEHLSNLWFKQKMPNISSDKLIGIHGTTINGVRGDGGRFDIEPEESKSFTTKHDLYLLDVSHIATAVDYALGWENSSTGNRDDDFEAQTGRPGILCVTDTDETKIQRQFGNVIVIPKGTKCTALAIPICEKLKKDVDRANIGHRLGLAFIARGLEFAGVIPDLVPQNELESAGVIPDLEPQKKMDKPLEEE